MLLRVSTIQSFLNDALRRWPWQMLRLLTQRGLAANWAGNIDPAAWQVSINRVVFSRLFAHLIFLLKNDRNCNF